MAKFPCEYRNGCKSPCIRGISGDKKANFSYCENWKLVSTENSETNSTDS